MVRPKFNTHIRIEDSNWIHAIQYDLETFVLDAQLNNGKRYRYRGISPQTFAKIVTAKSSGKAFNQLVRPLIPATHLPKRPLL